ncbi:single-stranded-DNA-specific exonuclease RecJ [Polymorphobacter sp. PAMC 29334]|uniref:single-stranded-DNA-specific exonuclease RecJ n=1 Tax=Polymorphobacter sp. PAMC 29334 TaxID=2862331 RepID=UPI001C7535C3|nr:single-stranded-DNA-specific exonuclease RecJ [Polymorphobacter sp. PAMC 29334]QYE33833.1 single-stranded-DNA-specific exonuclease RecJ [Polymorphobacter sp. PAMC 29334]
MSHVFNVTASVLGQPWQWRGGIAPGSGAAGGIDDLIEQLFRARGAAAVDLDRLRSAKLRDWLPDPSIFRDMDAAAARIAAAIRAAEPVVVFGDYDVDGATSAALLIRLIRDCGGIASAYIPDRLLEGYGPSPAAMVALAGTGATLIVTVDCGTQGFDALAAAKAAGVEVIVVDHHQASTALPPAVAVVNPNRLDETEGAAFGHLAAVGMAFIVAVAVVRTLRADGWFIDRTAPNLLDLLDLVALGTVADVVPLTGLNRAFVAQGLKVMAARRNLGLAALSAVAGIERAPLARDLGFALGPRINAGGRVGKSDLGVRLLTTLDPDEAATLAAELDRLNVERRAIEATVTDEAALLTDRTGNAAVAVIASGGWHPGVIGIVASRLKDKLKRPVIVIALEAGPDGGMIGKGSGRSVPGVDLGGAILAAKDMGLLIAGGGHAMAAGLTIDASRIDELAVFLDERLGGDVGRSSGGRALFVDAALSPRGVCIELTEVLDVGGPYGQGWPAPRVASGPWRVAKVDIVGDNHVRAILTGGDGARIKAMAFRSGDTPLGLALASAAGRWCFVSGRVQRDDWGRTPAAELHLDDLAWVD